jgi:cyanuric acid amidohydrolase
LVNYLKTGLMAPINIFKFSISSPADTSPLEELRHLGYEPPQILGVVGKTEGAILNL